LAADTISVFIDYVVNNKEKLVKGQLSVTIVNAPSAKAAFEYLIIDAAVGSSAMPEMIILYFNDQCTDDYGLGTVAYYNHGTVRFIRDNIAIVIDSHGEFMNEVLDIAKAIDAALLKQPMLTVEQLQARCPKLHLQTGRKAAETAVPFLEYSIEAPAGVQAWVSDIKINDIVRAPQDNIIFLLEKPNRVKVQATVISTELLVSTYEIEIEIPEGNETGIQE
jgi:hypothetical protein